jgi:AraC-like DNA-binding protein
MTLLRHRTVEDARREQLAEQVASMTHLSVGAVRGRISRANGHSLLRKVFVDVWPSALEELGALPAHALLREPKTIAELAEKLGASDQVVKRLLAEAAPATSTRKAVSTLWPSMSALGLDAIGQLRASEARSAAARSRIAAVLGISQAQVGRALSRAHGLSRIETIRRNNDRAPRRSPPRHERSSWPSATS